MVKRYELSDGQWERIAPLLPGKPGDRGRSGRDNRLFVNGVLWVLRSGARWEDSRAVQQMEDHTQALHSLGQSGVWEKVFDLLTGDPDNQYLMLDTTLVRVHQQAASGKGGQRSGCGAFPRRIRPPNPCSCRCPGSPSQLHPDRRRGARQHNRRRPSRRPHDGRRHRRQSLRQQCLAQAYRRYQRQPLIPSLGSRNSPIPHDAVAYKLRNRVERFFNKLKHFRHIATRYDRRAIHFLAALHLASAMIWMR